MAKYMRKLKAAVQLPAVDMGPLTRARKMALSEETAAAGSVAGKRRKVDGAEFRPRKERRAPPSRRSPAVAPGSGARRVAPRCSRSNDGGSCKVGGKGRLRSAADLEVVVAAASENCSGHRGEAGVNTADELESPATNTPPEARKSPAGSPAAAAAAMPQADEINAFFAEAEKRERARFADKYNFDVEKDAPVEGGRYEWVRLK